jgi:hypothetical protein
VLIDNAITDKDKLLRLGQATGIHCNSHSFRRGFCVHNVKSGLSNKVIQALGGWEEPDMVIHYSANLILDDAFRVYRDVNTSSSFNQTTNHWNSTYLQSINEASVEVNPRKNMVSSFAAATPWIVLIIDSTASLAFLALSKVQYFSQASSSSLCI